MEMIQTHIHSVLETEQGALGEKLTHFAMLIAARHWTQQVIWSLHDKSAIESGLRPEILDALASGRRPPASSSNNTTASATPRTSEWWRDLANAAWLRRL